MSRQSKISAERLRNGNVENDVVYREILKMYQLNDILKFL